MVDMFSAEKRTAIMSHIRSKNTGIEMTVRRYLHKNGFRYRLYDAALPGKPDIILSKYRTVVFINGCFWHSHSGCKYSRVPKTNAEYWSGKIYRNVKRDTENQFRLEEMGWRVIVVWECELKQDAVARCDMLVEQIVEGRM